MSTDPTGAPGADGDPGLPGLPPRLRPPAFAPGDAGAVLATAARRRGATRRNALVATAVASVTAVGVVAAFGGSDVAGLKPAAVPSATPAPSVTSSPEATPTGSPGATPTAVATATSSPTAGSGGVVPTGVPSVSVPPVPTVSLPPVVPPVPTPLACPEEGGSVPLPPATRTHPLPARDALAGSMFGAEGRLWYTSGPSEQTSVVSLDPGDGERVEYPVDDHLLLSDVVGDRAYLQGHGVTVQYDLATRARVRSWTSGDVPGAPVGVTADATGAWILGAGEDAWTVSRVGTDGALRWSVALPGSRTDGYWVGFREKIAHHDGSAYVGLVVGGHAKLWRVDAAGEVAAQVTAPYRSVNAAVRMTSGPGGVYAGIPVKSPGDHGIDSMIVRLDPALRLVGGHRADTVVAMFADADHLYVVGLWCASLVSRYDATSVTRTGFWRQPESVPVLEGGVAGGRTWLMRYTVDGQTKAVALERYDLS